ncbi:hypothetical protein [Grimontia sp. SpTr1]|uniref:hypothetical protein n=1 Tax=Grimontia sp. SpTr1 TaxID=2995319 RepID=UPI00248BC047|nr:hypothetical protein [Grimontia sp. SpTr1]
MKSIMTSLFLSLVAATSAVAASSSFVPFSEQWLVPATSSNHQVTALLSREKSRLIHQPLRIEYQGHQGRKMADQAKRWLLKNGFEKQQVLLEQQHLPKHIAMQISYQQMKPLPHHCAPSKLHTVGVQRTPALSAPHRGCASASMLWRSASNLQASVLGDRQPQSVEHR